MDFCFFEEFLFDSCVFRGVFEYLHCHVGRGEFPLVDLPHCSLSDLGDDFQLLLLDDEVVQFEGNLLLVELFVAQGTL